MQPHQAMTMRYVVQNQGVEKTDRRKTDFYFPRQIWLGVRLAQEENDVSVFVHDRGQMVFPKLDGIYGSAHLQKRRLPRRTYEQSFSITRTRWKTISSEEKRCDDNPQSEANTTGCVTRYLEAVIGCSIGLSGSDPDVQW